MGNQESKKRPLIDPNFLRQEVRERLLKSDQIPNNCPDPNLIILDRVTFWDDGYRIVVSCGGSQEPSPKPYLSYEYTNLCKKCPLNNEYQETELSETINGGLTIKEINFKEL